MLPVVAVVDVEDRVGQSARPVHDRRRPVAQGDHLALPAWLETRRHQVEIGSRIDAPGQCAVETLQDCDLARVPRRDSM